jgi:hypothetical protein
MPRSLSGNGCLLDIHTIRFSSIAAPPVSARLTVRPITNSRHRRRLARTWTEDFAKRLARLFPQRAVVMAAEFVPPPAIVRVAGALYFEPVMHQTRACINQALTKA